MQRPKRLMLFSSFTFFTPRKRTNTFQEAALLSFLDNLLIKTQTPLKPGISSEARKIQYVLGSWYCVVAASRKELLLSSVCPACMCVCG